MMEFNNAKQEIKKTLKSVIADYGFFVRGINFLEGGEGTLRPTKLGEMIETTSQNFYLIYGAGGESLKRYQEMNNLLKLNNEDRDFYLKYINDSVMDFNKSNCRNTTQERMIICAACAIIKECEEDNSLEAGFFKDIIYRFIVNNAAYFDFGMQLFELIKEFTKE